MNETSALKAPTTANSYDEWSRLREVVVGHSDLYNGHDIDSSFRLFYFDNVRPPIDVHRVEIPSQLLDELEEDIEELVKTLQYAKVKVLRPAPMRSHLLFGGQGKHHL